MERALRSHNNDLRHELAKAKARIAELEKVPPCCTADAHQTQLAAMTGVRATPPPLALQDAAEAKSRERRNFKSLRLLQKQMHDAEIGARRSQELIQVHTHPRGFWGTCHKRAGVPGQRITTPLLVFICLCCYT